MKAAAERRVGGGGWSGRCALLFLVAAGLPAAQAWGQDGLEGPRAPKRQRVTRVEQLLPNARLLVRRPFGWMAGAQYGLGLKKGERLLIVADGMDPLIPQALALAADEVGATVDVVAHGLSQVLARRGREEFDYARFNPATYMLGANTVSRAMPGWLAGMVDNYDVVLGFTARGTRYGWTGRGRGVRSAGLLWNTAGQFASTAAAFPDEVMAAIAGSTWKVMVQGRRFRVSDPLGTDITFSIDDTNRQRFAETRGLATHGDTTLQRPLANESSVQLEPQLSLRPDARGVLVTPQVGLMPTIRIYFEGGQVVRVEGGGAPGENIRQALERFKNTRFPGYYPGPGVGWLEEIALGTHPKVGPEGPLRHRSGLIQLAFGTDRPNTVSDTPPDLSPNHRDMDLFYYPTLEVDGRKLVDRGRLTTLDDPEVRSVAARHGDPDTLLREDWIPEFEQGSGRIVYPKFEGE